MKKIKYFIIIVCFFFLVSCDLGNNEEIKPDEKPTINANIELLNFDQKVMVGDSIDLMVNSNVDFDVVYDEAFVSRNDNKLVFIKSGETTVEIKYQNQSYGSFKVNIIEKIESIKITNVPEYLIVNSFYQLECNTSEEVIYSTSDNDLIKVKASGFVSVQNKGAGFVKVRCALASFPDIYDEVELHIVATNNKLVVKKDATQDLIIGDYYYELNTSLFTSLQAAINKAVPRNDIYVVGAVSENVEISKENVKIYGNLSGAEGGTLTGTINIANEIEKVYIENLSFTENCHINLAGANQMIYIRNNYFYDTTPNETKWAETASYTDGIIKLAKADSHHDHIEISGNEFHGIGDCAINASTVLNIELSNNIFDGFSKDAIRFNDGIVKAACAWRIRDNVFNDGAYCGIFFRTYASNSSDIDHYVEILGNSFTNCGKVNALYSACIAFRNYQEGRCEINISFNSFSDSAKYLFLRNNAKEANQANYNAYITYNNFLSAPSTYYFNNLNASDQEATNPKQALMQYNYFSADLNDALFIGLKENTNLLSAEVGSVDKALYDVRHVIDAEKLYPIPEGFALDADGATLLNGFFSFDGIGQYEALFTGESDFHFSFNVLREVELIVKFINIALGEIGYQEVDANGQTGTSGNYTKYGAWYGINPGAWCAMYVSWCAYQAGVPSTIIPRYASVSIGMEWFQKQGLFQYKENYTPKAGDLMFMKSDGASHTGIVLYCDGKTLYTVEGNTSDCCALRKYDVTYSKITGYGTPLWPYYSPDGYNFSSGNPSDGGNQSTT